MLEKGQGVRLDMPPVSVYDFMSSMITSVIDYVKFAYLVLIPHARGSTLTPYRLDITDTKEH